MRRPITFFAISLTNGILTGYFIGMSKIYLLLIVAIILLQFIRQILYLKKYGEIIQKSKIYFLAIGFIIGFCLIMSETYSEKIIPKHCNEKIGGEGVIISVTKVEDDFYRILVDVNQLNLEENKEIISEKVLISYYGSFLKEYDEYSLVGRSINFIGKVNLPETRKNPNTFDYRMHLKTLGIYSLVTCSQNEIQIIPTISGKYNFCINYLSKCKGNTERNLKYYIGEYKMNIVSGMLFGDTDKIEEQIMNKFRMNGVAHILAVSGIHIGILYMFLNKVIFRNRKLWSDFIIVIILISYSAMAMFTSSVIRAAIMIILHMISKKINYRFDLLSAASTTYILMVLYNPLSIFNIGFQLSFLAIFSIAILTPLLKNIGAGIIGEIIGLQLGLSPFIAYTFNYFSFSALIINAPIIFLAGLIIPFGIILIPLSNFHISITLIQILSIIIGALVDLMIYINDAFYNGGKSFVYVISPSFSVIILYYSLLFFLSSELFRILFEREKNIIILKFISTFIIISIISYYGTYNEFNKAEIVFVDVGQGDCIHIKTEDGKNYLIDGGGNINYDVGKKILLPYLLKNGVKHIDGAFLTHLHIDHYEGIKTLSQMGIIDNIYLYEGNIVKGEEIQKNTRLNKSQIKYLSKAEKIYLSPNVYISVLSPDSKSIEEYKSNKQFENDENISSLILKLTYKSTTLLVTGDIDKAGEKMLVENYKNTNILKSDILKVSHHGSKYSSSNNFLDSVNPIIAVIQTGKNNFGHPHEETLEVIQKRKAEIYRNDYHGAIGFVIDENSKKYKKIRVITVKQLEP